MENMKRVFICSPFRGLGGTEEQKKHSYRSNMHTARAACEYAVIEGHMPFAPHLYFPQFLMDSDPDEREIGMLLGLLWMKECDEVWIIGRSVSEGMSQEIRQAEAWGIPIRHYVPQRTPEERLLDAIFHPEIDYREMEMPDEAEDGHQKDRHDETKEGHRHAK